MPLTIVRNDITTMAVDAIVNAANETLLGGGGVDGCIHRAAGPRLLEECRTLGGCRTGEAKITKGYLLPARYVIHTVGPIWHGGHQGEREKLVSAYKNSLKLAAEYGCETVAFPLISAGVYGYPKDQALRVALETITVFLNELEGPEMLVYLVIFNRDHYFIEEERFRELSILLKEACGPGRAPEKSREYVINPETPLLLEDAQRTVRPAQDMPFVTGRDQAFHTELLKKLDHSDENFADMLFRLIDEKGMSDSECYKKANLSRKLFSKIRSSRSYKPSKLTAVALVVALELPLSEAQELLMKAGYAFSNADQFDIIVSYFISKKIYNVYEINEALFAFGQNLLGVTS